MSYISSFAWEDCHNNRFAGYQPRSVFVLGDHVDGEPRVGGEEGVLLDAAHADHLGVRRVFGDAENKC